MVKINSIKVEEQNSNLKKEQLSGEEANSKNDLSVAKNLLTGENTCVLVKGEAKYISTLDGIKPMIDFLERQIDLEGFSVADLVVGKAVAYLFVLAKVKRVYAKVLSESASKVFEKYNIKFEYETIVENIINRKKTGICPMESAVLSCNDPAEAFEILKEKLNNMSK